MNRLEQDSPHQMMKTVIRVGLREGRISEKKIEGSRLADKTFEKKQMKTMKYLLAFLSSPEVKTKTIPTALKNLTYVDWTESSM